jgi:hypothetical protein
LPVVGREVIPFGWGANIAGALVTDGIDSIYTNAYGGYGVNVSKSGYVARTVAVYASQSGTTQTFCLSDACSAVAGALIDAVYEEYWQFSPAVAEKLDANKLARQGALLAAVRPLVAWYQLSGDLAFDHRNTTAVENATKTPHDACPRWMSSSSLADLIATLRRREPVPANAPQTLRELAPHLHQAASLPLVDWAVLRPLQMCWMIAAQRLNPASEIADWLSDAPVDRGAALATADHVAHADAVGALLAFNPAAQRRLLDRLQAAIANRSQVPSTPPGPATGATHV